MELVCVPWEVDVMAKLLGALFGLAVFARALVASAEPPAIFVGGQFIRQTAIEDQRGHLLVPVRGVFEALGATVVYTPPRIVVVRKNEAVVAGLVIDRRAAVVANRRRNLDVAPIRLNGHVYVPLRSVAELAGATVHYSANPRLVDIRVPNNDLTRMLPARHVPDVPDEPLLPVWAYAVVGVFVFGFALELARRVYGAMRTGPRRPAYRESAVVSAARALQLPRSIDARDQHGIGEIAK